MAVPVSGAHRAMDGGPVTAALEALGSVTNRLGNCKLDVNGGSSGFKELTILTQTSEKLLARMNLFSALVVLHNKNVLIIILLVFL